MRGCARLSTVGARLPTQVVPLPQRLCTMCTMCAVPEATPKEGVLEPKAAPKKKCLLYSFLFLSQTKHNVHNVHNRCAAAVYLFVVCTLCVV